MFIGIGLPITSRFGVSSAISSGALDLLAGDDGLALDFTDDTWFTDSGFYGSAAVVGGGTSDGYDTSPDTAAASLLTYTSPSVKMTMGPSGTLRFGAHNLCLRSEDFTTTWTAQNVTAAATSMTDNVSSGRHACVQAISLAAGVPIAATVRMSAGTGNFGVLCISDAGAAYYTAVVNLSTGAITQTAASSVSGQSSSIVSVGGGAYDVTVNVNAPAATTYIYVGLASAATGNTLDSAGVPTYSGAGVSINASRAHVRRTPSDSTYLATTSTARYALPYQWTSAGVLEGILVEEARTNLCLRSQEFGNSAWAGPYSQNTTVTSDSEVAPDGTTTADTLTATGASARRNNQATVNNQTVTFSLWAKRKTGTGAIYLYTNIEEGGTKSANLAGQINSSTWTRISHAALTRSGGSGTAHMVVEVETSGDEIYVWGAQYEVGSFPTSYIPTIASTVTRAADTKNNATTIAPSIATAGTRVINARTALASGTQVLGTIDDGTANERYRIERNSSNEIRFIVTDGGVEQANLNLGTVANDTEFKVAVAWAANDIAGCLNGGTVQTDGAATLPTVTTQRYGSSSTGQQWCGVIKSDVLFNTRKANATLQTLSA